MKITFFEITNLEKERFEKELQGHDVVFFEEKIQDVNTDKFSSSEVLCVFIHSRVSEDILSKCPNLKLVATRSTGVDHIDQKYCQNNNIQIKNVPLYGENTVAEHVFALMLSISRRIEKSINRTKSGNFSTNGLQGFDLKDKTIGLIGGGRIGMHVARIARSFGMHVRVYDINKDDFMAEVLNFKYVSLDELLATSDIISLHVPQNKYTENIISKETIQKMKDGVVIINTARGGLIDTDALIEAIDNKKISGAGLDVIAGEELLFEENIFNSPTSSAAQLISQSKRLVDNENVVITPHNAFNSIEAVNRIIDTTVENILNV
ncbi:MAG: NAD(P)-binding domain-containing protein [Oscillospiraceae bacterium]|nr:NAD(P)-binding domain-containing protein [Oscillospiraceae bacterium]